MKDAPPHSDPQPAYPEPPRAGRVAAVTIETAPLAAWRHRGDWKKRDALWSAACWCASALERKSPHDRTADFKRAAKLVDNEPEAGFAVAELFRVQAPKGDGITAAPNRTADWNARLRRNAERAAGYAPAARR